MYMTITLSKAPIKEFKTKKAAEKFSKKVIQQTKVIISEYSAFDMFAKGNKFFWVVLDE